MEEQIAYIRQSELLKTRIPVSKSAYNAGIKSGRYPAPVKLSERTAAYRLDEINLVCRMLAYGFCWRDRDTKAWKDFDKALREREEAEAAEVAK